MSGGRWSRGDIDPVEPPDLSRDAWRDPAAALRTLHDWAVRYTTEITSWYLRDKRFKRWASRLLRAAAVVLAVAGGLAPLTSRRDSTWGYTLIALAAGCVAFDHFFGLSAGWMRDMTTAQALQARMVRFHLDWAALESRDDTATGIELVDGLLTDVLELTNAETAEWVSQFSTAISALRRQTEQ